MPIAATPLEQLVVAPATNLTLFVTVLLLLGEVTVTPANADDAISNKTAKAYFCICSPAYVFEIPAIPSGKLQALAGDDAEMQLLQGSVFLEDSKCATGLMTNLSAV
jgi:hypothetical protein